MFQVYGVKAAVHSKVMVLLSKFCCLVGFPLAVGVLCMSLFCYAIFLKSNRELVAMFSLSYRCLITVNVL